MYVIEFDKDDIDTLDFVTASSNMRSFAYGIELKTKWDVKGTSEETKLKFPYLI